METHVTLCEMRAPGTQAYMNRLMRNYRRYIEVRKMLNEVMSRDLADEYANRIDGIYSR
jgi:uncharacterized protein YjiS (DUF1127 family)